MRNNNYSITGTVFWQKFAHQNKKYIYTIILMLALAPNTLAFSKTKTLHPSKQTISCPAEFDEVECDSFQDGVRNGQLDEMTAIPNPFLEEAEDSAIHAMPYIRGYELIRGRRKK
jgi:hypothetical protein